MEPESPASPAALLGAPIATLPGATPDRATALARAGLHTALDLLFLFPREYEDFSDLRTVDRLEEDKPQTVRGEVTEVDSRGSYGKTRVGVIVRDDAGGALRATWFNQLFMRDKFKLGQRVQLSGKPKKRGLSWEMAHPRVAWLEAGAPDPVDEGLLPVYPLTEGVSQFHMRRLVAGVVERFAEAPREVFTDALMAEHRLMPLADALRAIHHPGDEASLALARRRFVFQELFVLQLALAARRQQQTVGFRAPEVRVDAQIDARITRLLPFELTAGQRRAIQDITTDLASTRPMSRLLQGDVGSGKTMVALYAMLATVAAGFQAVLMAPTEVLARQHAQTFAGVLSQSRVRRRLLVGGQRDAERAEALAALASGEADLAIGTHALLQEGVEFANLGLVVVDEQHKFGVRQRAALRRGDRSPHYLVMTATPIPRTIAMTQFGDFDVSVLREAPAGRAPVQTFLVPPDQHDRWWASVRERLRAGRQAFVVAPLVDESDAISAQSAAEAYERLTNGELEAFTVGLVHGRLSSEEKQQVMNDFRDGRLQVLVATTVVEVGVDVPNATVMTIASPERFGLSQLHQLRGRVGRGVHPGVCGLMPDAELTDLAARRLEAFVKTTDGFELAELDFALRGPGELLGDRQSGASPLRLADLTRDAVELAEAREAARRLFAADPGLCDPAHALLRRQMLARYGKALELADVG